VLFAWSYSIDLPRSNLLVLTIVVCLAAGILCRFFPAAFGVHWRTYCFAMRVMLVLIDNDVHTFALMCRLASGKLHAWTLVELEAGRLFGFTFFASIFPISLPAWGLAQVPLNLTQAFSSASKYHHFQGLQCQYIPWPVATFMHSISRAFLEHGVDVSDVARCRVGVVFWKVQTEMMGAICGILRDVASRRSFLRAHPHLIGNNGAARAAAWPFGCPSTVVTSVSLVIWLGFLNVMAVDFWVSAIVGSDKMQQLMNCNSLTSES
jgi:hypothetical protein